MAYRCSNCGQDGIGVDKGAHWDGIKVVKCSRCKCSFEVSFYETPYAPGHEERDPWNIRIDKVEKNKGDDKKKRK